MKKVKILMIILIIGFLAVGSFLVIMVNYDHNAEMYLPSSVLLMNGFKLFKDFSFVQSPYLPLIYGNIFKIINPSHYLLSEKFISFIMYLISALMIYLVSRKITKDVFFSISMTCLFFLNKYIVYASATSSNYIMPCTLTLIAFYLFIIKSGNYLKYFLSGMLLAIAAGIKIYHAMAITPFFLISFFLPKEYNFMERVKKILLPFSIGLISGFIPMLYYMFNDFHVFYFNAIQFHVLTTQYRISIGSFPTSKIYFLRRLFTYPDFIAIFIILFTLIIVYLFLFKKNIKEKIFSHREKLLLLLLSVISFAVIISAPYLYDHYLLFPLPFFILLSAYLIAELDHKSKFFIKCLMIPALIIALSNTGHTYIKYTYKYYNPKTWIGNRVHKIAFDIKAEFEKNGNKGKIATLTPVFVLDSGMEIYDELVGPFGYRMADEITEEERKKYILTSPKTIYRMLEKEPPAAIFTGFEFTLEQPLIEFANNNNYKKVDKHFGAGIFPGGGNAFPSGGTLYLRK